MVRISKAVEYALAAVRHMYEHPGSLVSARDLVGTYQLPAGLVAKILQRLAAAGILASEQGVHGGYRLVRDPDTLSFLALTEAVDGPVRVAACDTGGSGTCDRGDVCTVSEPVHRLSEQIVGLLEETKIGPLLRGETERQAHLAAGGS